MAERLIEHPLRTIRLVFDDSKEETEADKEMIRRYVEIHDSFLALKKQYAKLRFDYQEVEDLLGPVATSFTALDSGAKALIGESEVLLTKVRREDAIEDVLDRMNEFQPVIGAFHNDELMPLADAIEELNAPWDAYNQADEQFDELFDAYYDEVDLPFYEQTELHALDLDSYFDDMEDLKGHFDKQSKANEVEEVINKYDDLVNEVNALYAQWKEAQEALIRFFADDKMLDRSLSEACKRGEVPKELSPIYLVAPDDETVDGFASTYGMLAHKANNKLSISVPTEVVKQGENVMVQEIVMALQHFPHLMEKMLFSIDFTFVNEFGGELGEDDWKGIEQPVRWFNGMSSLPCTYFFLADRDARHYFLMGDLVFDGKVKPTEDGEMVGLEGEALDMLANRVFNVGCFFMLYCHNTGIDPTPHVQRMLDEMQLPISVDDIRKEFETSIANGIELRVQKVKKSD